MNFTIIVAHYKNIIGVEENGILKLPWSSIKEDMRYFREKTLGSVLIVGRKTYETLPKLKDREFVIITRDRTAIYDTNVAYDFESALLIASKLNKKIFVIGGGEIYKLAITHKNCMELDITEIHNPKISVGCPIAYFPEIPKNYQLVSSQSLDILTRKIYKLVCEEENYLNSLKKILETGIYKKDRTGVGTISLFSEILRFNFFKSQDGYYTFPLLTTKKMFTRGIIEELLFFLRGGVDNNILNQKNIHIWDGNTSREFLDKIGMNSFEEGSLGKSYGFQWRFWGSEWKGKNADYSCEKVYDQISIIIKQLKEDPYSRRIILSAWNVSDLAEMCLPPCHTMYIFNVSEGKLFCHLTQRSGDMFLGIPFNIASASFLTFILAKCTGLEPGGLVISIVDAHIYINHVESCKVQLTRTPYSFPTLKIIKEIRDIKDIESLSTEDFSIKDYKCYPSIKADMAV